MEEVERLQRELAADIFGVPPESFTSVKNWVATFVPRAAMSKADRDLPTLFVWRDRAVKFDPEGLVKISRRGDHDDFDYGSDEIDGIALAIWAVGDVPVDRVEPIDDSKILIVNSIGDRYELEEVPDWRITLKARSSPADTPPATTEPR